MSKVFVYYSESGNGEYVASIMQNKGFEIIKIKPKKSLPESFFLKIENDGSAYRRQYLPLTVPLLMLPPKDAPSMKRYW